MGTRLGNVISGTRKEPKADSGPYGNLDVTVVAVQWEKAGEVK